jgi:type II secretory pathway component PulK
MKHQRGIALIMVLMVAGILALLVLQMTLTAREHVARAQLLADRAEATLRAQSREAALDFTLLTHGWVAQGGADNPYAAAWNFRGQPFTVDGITYRLQDVSGLLSLTSDNEQGFVALLRALGVAPDRAGRLGEQFTRLQAAEQGLARPGVPTARESPAELRTSIRQGAAAFPLQSLDELHALPDMDEALLARLEPLLTLYATPGFNPLTAPRELLAARIPGSQLQGVLELRAQGRLDQGSLSTLTGLGPDEQTTFYPGPAIRIELGLEYHGAVIRRETTAILRPYLNEALAVWSRRQLSEGRTPHD